MTRLWNEPTSFAADAGGVFPTYSHYAGDVLILDAAQKGLPAQGVHGRRGIDNLGIPAADELAHLLLEQLPMEMPDDVRPAALGVAQEQASHNRRDSVAPVDWIDAAAGRLSTTQGLVSVADVVPPDDSARTAVVCVDTVVWGGASHVAPAEASPDPILPACKPAGALDEALTLVAGEEAA